MTFNDLYELICDGVVSSRFNHNERKPLFSLNKKNTPKKFSKQLHENVSKEQALEFHSKGYELFLNVFSLSTDSDKEGSVLSQDSDFVTDKPMARHLWPSAFVRFHMLAKITMSTHRVERGQYPFVVFIKQVTDEHTISNIFDAYRKIGIDCHKLGPISGMEMTCGFLDHTISASNLNYLKLRNTFDNFCIYPYNYELNSDYLTYLQNLLTLRPDISSRSIYEQ